MNAVRMFLVAVLAVCAVLVPAAAVPVGPVPQGTPAWTPPPGHAERKAILAELRAEVLRLQNLQILFVVRCVKVEDGWAWIQTLP